MLLCNNFFQINLFVMKGLLPPANEVWGKVIFLHLSVILFTVGVCLSACWDTTPPGAEHAGRYGQRAGGTHPTGMQSCSISIFYGYILAFSIFVN